MRRLEAIASFLFGGIFVILALMIALETILRKFFSLSIQGADELGGYALAAGGTIAFSLALLGRAHMRIDIFHQKLPAVARALLNSLSALLMAAFSLVLMWVANQVVMETLDYGSAAATPWATPLIYPQSVWFAGLSLFALLAVGYGLWSLWLLFTGRINKLNEDFHPRSVAEEVQEELADLQARASEIGNDDKKISTSVIEHSEVLKPAGENGTIKQGGER